MAGHNGCLNRRGYAGGNKSPQVGHRLIKSVYTNYLIVMFTRAVNTHFYMRLIFLKRAHHRFLNKVRRVQVRLAALKLVDSGALGSQLHYAIADIDDVRKPNVVESSCEAEHAWRGW